MKFVYTRSTAKWLDITETFIEKVEDWSAAAGQNRISRKEMLLLPQKLGGNSEDKSSASLRLLFSKVSTVGD